jgi:hypothetical protein
MLEALGTLRFQEDTRLSCIRARISQTANPAKKLVSANWQYRAIMETNPCMKRHPMAVSLPT